MIIEEQEKVLGNDKKRMLVSASAGSGKTYVMIKYITNLICEKKIPVKNFLVLTFTKAAATEMKERLQKRLKEKGNDPFIVEQLDYLSVSNISTIHSFCEKNLKKYANLLGLNENFEIADENFSQNIRQNAFENAISKFEQQNFEDYFQLVSSFKDDKSKIRDILFEIEFLVNSISDKETFLKENIENSEKFYEKAINYLTENFKNVIKTLLSDIEKLHVDEFSMTLQNVMKEILASDDIYQLTKNCKDFKFPLLPKKKEVGEEIVDKLNSLKKNINKAIKNILDLNLDNDDICNYQRSGKLEKILIALYLLYENEENAIKKSKNCLDFYDLEKYMKKLSLEENLFQGIKYVFVDEYQDTNQIQERIIKNIAKNSNFVAVGDVKQGIYGFRLASSEIFLKDIETFDNDKDSVVRYLKSNFRSSQKVLDFVNNVFKVCMTQESCGVNYQESSMLEGKSDFVEEGEKAVHIDLLETLGGEEKELPLLYSVKDDKLYVDNKNLLQLQDIKRRINEVMSSKISVDGHLRPCRYSDIAILARKRDGLFDQLEDYLQKSGIPVVSNSRNILLDEPEVRMLLNYLKVVLNNDDEVALASVLLSGLCDFNLNQIIENKKDKSLCQMVVDDENGIFKDFKQNLEDFYFDVNVYGIKKAFLNLFNKTNYRTYINQKLNHAKINLFIEKFLNEIASSGFEFDLPGLINYFENVDITVTADITSNEDAVVLTTIHNSKGLEYPVVFLIGCDQNFKKSQPKVDVEINENFGLAVKFYDQENNKEIISAKMRAIKEFESHKDFVEELMIFYVALTRAKNRLYLFGNLKTEKFEDISVENCESYIELVFYALKKERNEFLSKGSFVDDDIEIIKIDEIEEIVEDRTKNFDYATVDDNFMKKMNDFLNFKYKIDDKNNFKLKETVTNLNLKNVDNELERFSNDNFTFSSPMVDIGNAYHLALKVLDFSKINTEKDLEEQLEKNREVLEGSVELVDKRVLFENILLLQKITQGTTIFKEQEFIMKERVCDLLEKTDVKDKILVQGVVDLFAVKDKEIILVDYKYSNSNNDEYLINKYKNQLKLYKMAIEHAFKLKINQIYLLSLKHNKLIKVEI